MQVEDWQEIEYEAGVSKQLEAVEAVHAGAADRLVFCTHPPVVTLGRASQDSDVFSWDGPLIQASRGGRATYHGPSQQVIYPIVNLDRAASELFKKRDIHSYLRTLETALVSTLHFFGIDKAEAKTVQVESAGKTPLQLTGVWVENKKIASIGIAVKKWVTYHGIALNVDNDPKAFQGINPCGYQPGIMTSMEQVLGHKVERSAIQQALIGRLAPSLDAMRD